MAINDSKGFILIHRKMLDWEWYKNINTKVLFLHLLLKANYAPGKHEGQVIERGELMTSYPLLSAETGLSVKEIRTALNHLNGAGITAVRKMPKYSIISIKNYNQYQERAGKRAGEGQAKGRQGAGTLPIYINNNNNNNKNKEYIKRAHTHARKRGRNFLGDSEPSSYDIEEWERFSIFDNVDEGGAQNE